jgi:segregation and condensation protein A
MEKQNPLGVLLDFLNNKKLEISEISLAKVADDFLNYLEKSKDQKAVIENMSEFLWVASKLALLKSRLALKTELFGEEDFVDNDSSELKQRLIEYKKIKEISLKIKKILIKEKTLFNRKNRELFKDKNFYFNFKKEKLSGYFLRLIENIKKNQRIFYQNKKIKETIKIEDKIKQIKLILTKIKKFNFSKLIQEKDNSLEITVSFLSVLELFKQGRIDIKQNGNFSEMELSIIRMKIKNN